MQIKSQLRSSLVTAATHRQILRGLLLVLAQEHKREILPEHFEPVAVRRYGYKLRTKGYMIRKGKEHGHQNPLVLYGPFQRSVLGTAKATSTPTRGTIRASTGTAVQKQYAQEVEAVSPEEIHQKLMRLGDLYSRAANLPKFQRQRKRG